MKDFLSGTRKALLPVRDRIVFVADGKEAVPGVTATATPGHTVGHTAYVISSGPRSLLFSGDLAHHQVILLQRPKLEFSFDTDPKQAVASRIRSSDMAAANRMQVLSHHFPFPRLGPRRQGERGLRLASKPPADPALRTCSRHLNSRRGHDIEVGADPQALEGRCPARYRRPDQARRAGAGRRGLQEHQL